MNTRDRRFYDEIRKFPAELFQFDARIADGWLSDRYFLRTQGMAAHAGIDPVVTMQIFCKRNGVLAGVYEVLRMLQTQLRGTTPEDCDLRVWTLPEGSPVEPWKPVMHIRGPYSALGHLETPILGVLARRSLVASNTRLIKDAASGKPIIFMAARHDDWRVQAADGYAAMVGGADAVSSDANGNWWGLEGVGTMPHAAIALFGGDTVAATLAFTRYAEVVEPGIKVISLVDYKNDCTRTAVNVARAMEAEFGPGKLYGVRLDTSEKMVDVSLQDDAERFGAAGLSGVNGRLVHNVRTELDRHGYQNVAIVVSGGFTPAKIRSFESVGIPADVYGVGSSILGHSDPDKSGMLTGMDFTGDLVEVDGRLESKLGRARLENPEFIAVDWTTLNTK